MASDETLEASALRREALGEVTSSRSLEDSEDCESRSGGSEDTETTSNDSERAKVAAAAATARVTFDFTASSCNTLVVL
jgi:hypothetical protein